ncbi:MAG: EamA family transporter [Oscillospiraceae bacterium]|nr:EamA family transporter [Oscillospiraceae bacterium]
MKAAAERGKYIVAVVLYGTIGLFLRHVQAPSEVVALFRGVLGSAFIFLYQRFRGRRPDGKAIRKAFPLLILSGVSLGLNWIFLFAAYVKTTVAIASLCNYLAPAVVIVIAPAVLRERLDLRKIPFVLLALAGILLVSGVLETGGGDTAGVLLGLAAAVFFVLVVICNRKLREVPALDRSMLQLAISAATILPYVLIRNWGAFPELGLSSLGIILMLGIVHTGLAYCFYFSGMGSLPVQTVAILGYLEPVVSVLCSVAFLHEPLSLPGWIGAALVLISTAVSEALPEKVSQKASGGAS